MSGGSFPSLAGERTIAAPPTINLRDPLMKICLKLAVCLTVLVGPALAQAPAFKRPPQSPAFVYVSTPTQIEAFGVSSSGELTPVPPFPNISVSHLSANLNFLFGTDANGKYVYTFSIFSSGGLQLVAKTDVSKYIPDPHFGLVMQIDPSGSDLYVGVTNYVKGGTESSYLESFKIEANGELQYLGKTEVALYTISELRFAPSTHYAYQTGCLIQSVNPGTEKETPITSEFRRESNGFLTFLGTTDEVPKAEGSDHYCPFALASDPTDHLAFIYRTLGSDTGIGSYKVSAEGKLTTKSNYKNMPAIAVYPHTASISPTGALLAVGGGSAFQLFHFNGSAPVTTFSPAIAVDDNLLEFGWDQNNHLFSLSGSSLFVYTVTPTSIEQTVGSPISIPGAGSVIVVAEP
jgi:hypothetical protein